MCHSSNTAGFKSLHGKDGDQIGKVMPVLAIYRVTNIIVVI